MAASDKQTDLRDPTPTPFPEHAMGEAELPLGKQETRLRERLFEIVRSSTPTVFPSQRLLLCLSSFCFHSSLQLSLTGDTPTPHT